MTLPSIMDVGELDEYCTRLLAVFLLERHTYRFNELKEYLKKKGLRMSVPTLIDHLEHLTKKQLVLREEKDKQFVTYRFHWEKWQDSDQLMKERIQLEKMLQQEMDEFSKRPVIEQVSYVHRISVLLFFQTLRESIVAKLKPETEFVAHIDFIHSGNIFDRARNMILGNIEKKGEKYATECLLTIDTLVSLYTEAMEEYENFRKFELPTIHITNETNDLLDKIHSLLNIKRAPKNHLLRSDVVYTALNEYAKTLKIAPYKTRASIYPPEIQKLKEANFFKPKKSVSDAIKKFESMGVPTRDKRTAIRSALINDTMKKNSTLKAAKEGDEWFFWQD